MAEVVEELNEEPVVEEVSDQGDPVEAALKRLKEKFAGDVEDDTRQRYSGLVVSADKLLDVSKFVKEERLARR